MNEQTLILGDCLTELGAMDSESIDLLATDPPYGISFMGKDWDKALPSVEIWRECFRVLKPGSFAFVMSLPRLDVLSQMAIRLQEAAFRVDFTPLFWAFASGFPKATNVSKAVDKKLGVKREITGTVKAPSTSTGRNESEDFGEYRDIKAEDGYRLTELSNPASLEAKALDGSYAGFQPKPALEVIIVAMKPLSEKTYVEQALKNQKGITWLDDARIPFQSEVDAETAHDNALGPVERFRSTKRIYEGGKDSGGFADTFSDKGRFPANLIVSDDALNDGSSWKAGGSLTGNEPSNMGNKITLGEFGSRPSFQSYGDSGSFSRFFSLEAWWDKRLSELPESIRKTFPFLTEPKASKEERNEGLEGIEPKMRSSANKMMGDAGVMKTGSGNNRTVLFRNHHPTVKPLAIMSYLITLGSRRGDTVLDPFAGSGTTIMAAKMLGRKGIGIEINPEYAKIAEARIASVSTLEEFA